MPVTCIDPVPAVVDKPWVLAVITVPPELTVKMPPVLVTVLVPQSRVALAATVKDANALAFMANPLSNWRVLVLVPVPTVPANLPFEIPAALADE